MADFTLVRPANDAVALELSGWCVNKKASVLSNGHVIANDLHASAATRSAVTSALSGSRCVLFFGHGKDAELLGSGGALVDAANIGSASGAIVVAIACLSSKVLGPNAVHAGVDGYLGFSERLVWVSRDPDGQFEPTVTAGIDELLSGNNLGDAEAAMQRELNSVVQFYLNGAGQSPPNRALGWLSAFWDAQHVRLDGNAGATL
jgi:hypothetical protein